MPYNPALHGFAAYHGVHFIGKREADAEAEAKPWLYAGAFAYAPVVYAPAYTPLVAHPNGALVPVEPADVCIILCNTS